jgi:hypothetical protein
MSIYIGMIWVILIVVLIVIRLIIFSKHVRLLKELFPKELNSYNFKIQFWGTPFWDDIGRNNYESWQKKSFYLSYYFFSRYNKNSRFKVDTELDYFLLRLSKTNMFLYLVLIVFYLLLWIV